MVPTKRVSAMARASTPSLEVPVSIMANGVQACEVGWAPSATPTRVATWVNGRMISAMDGAHTPIPMGIATAVTGLQMFVQVLAHTCMHPMGAASAASGTMESARMDNGLSMIRHLLSHRWSGEKSRSMDRGSSEFNGTHFVIFQLSQRFSYTTQIGMQSVANLLRHFGNFEFICSAQHNIGSPRRIVLKFHVSSYADRIREKIRGRPPGLCVHPLYVVP
jgi:hypothetical protein